MALTTLEWLRKLLEDEPHFESEATAASGAELVFFVSNPPIAAGSDRVFVAGEPKVRGTDYTVEESKRIAFQAPAPAKGTAIQIEYARQTWGDVELDHYLTQAALDWVEDRHVVYKALIYAVDSILMGAATGLNFGSGDENYDIVSVWQRLLERRDLAIKFLEEAAEEPFLVMQDILFDVDDPEFPGDWGNAGSLMNPGWSL